MVRETFQKWEIVSCSVLLMLVCGCNGAKSEPRTITLAEKKQILHDPLAAMAQARSKSDGALFFEAGKELISSKKIYSMTVKQLSENIGKSYRHNWEASRFFGLPSGRTAWLFGAGRATLFVAARNENRRIKKARMWWMDAKLDEVIILYPPEKSPREGELEGLDVILLLYYLTNPLNKPLFEFEPDKTHEEGKAK